MLRLSLDALLVLDTIDRRGSFAAAAEELHRVPSAVTYAVQKLEQDLDVKLFLRDGRRAALTPAGAELLRDGRELLRAAAALEARTKRVATGWEAELRIALDDLIPTARLFPLLERFYAGACGTRVRLSTEVLAGTWDALVDDRADLVIGAPGDAPPNDGYTVLPIGEVEFVFAVAPRHPLANAPEPLTRETLLQYRAVSVADSSRTLPRRTAGLLTGQDVLTVAEMHTKLAAQRIGLGIGFVPTHLAAEDFAQGALVAKIVEEQKPRANISLAWRTEHRGKALQWFIHELQQHQLL